MEHSSKLEGSMPFVFLGSRIGCPNLSQGCRKETQPNPIHGRYEITKRRVFGFLKQRYNLAKVTPL